MNLLKRILPVVLMCTLLLPLAAAKPVSEDLIPGDSRVIGAVNFKSLNKKGGFEEENFFEQLNKRLDGELNSSEMEELSAFIKDTKDVGIDEDGKLYFFYIPDFTAIDKKEKAGLILPVKDKELLEKMMRKSKLIDDEVTIRNLEGFRYLAKDEVFLFWDKGHLILLISDALGADAGEKEVERHFRELFLNRQNRKKLNSHKELRPLLKEAPDFAVWTDAGVFMQKIIRMESGLDRLEDWKVLISEYENKAKECTKLAADNPYDGPKVPEGDFYYYDGTDFIAEGNYTQAAKWYRMQAEDYRRQAADFERENKEHIQSTEEVLKKYQDLTLTFKGNFLNGRIALDFDIYTGRNLKFPGPSSITENKGLTKFVPENSLFLLGASFDLEEYYAFLTEISFGKMKKQLKEFENSLGSLDLTVNEFLSTFTGQLFMSVYDVKLGKEDARVFFALEVKNKKRLKDIIETMTANESFTKRIISGLEVYIPSGSDQEDPATAFIIIRDNILYVANGEARDNLIAGKIPDQQAKVKKVQISYQNSLIGLLDFSYLSQMISQAREESGKITDKASLYLLDQLEGIGVNITTINRGHLSCLLTIDFSNKKDNSMKQLKNMLLDFLEEEFKKEKGESF